MGGGGGSGGGVGWDKESQLPREKKKKKRVIRAASLLRVEFDPLRPAIQSFKRISVLINQAFISYSNNLPRHSRNQTRILGHRKSIQNFLLGRPGPTNLPGFCQQEVWCSNISWDANTIYQFKSVTLGRKDVVCIQGLRNRGSDKSEKNQR